MMNKSKLSRGCRFFENIFKYMNPTYKKPLNYIFFRTLNITNVCDNPNPNIQMIVPSLQFSLREEDLKRMTNPTKNTK